MLGPIGPRTSWEKVKEVRQILTTIFMKYNTVIQGNN
jgi:hypothetical protein